MQKNKSESPELKKLSEFLKRYKFIFLVLLGGVFLLLIPTKTEGKTAYDSSESCGTTFEIAELEKRMEKILSQIEGTGNLSLLLTLKGDSENIYAMNTEYREDEGESEERLEIVTVSTGSGIQKPLIISRNYPPFQGALVVCDGGDDPTIKLLVTKAVAVLTGLGTDRITVCK